MSDDDGDTPPGDAINVAGEVSGQAVCPYCGDTLTWIGADGYSLCVHDGIDVWVPPNLRR